MVVTQRTAHRGWTSNGLHISRREFVGGMSGAAVGGAIATLSGLAQAATPAGPVLAALPSPPPPLSEAERRLRFSQARALLQRHNLDALLIAPAEEDYEAADYLVGPVGASGFRFYPVVCLPRESEPFAFAPPDVAELMPASIILAMESAGIRPWITNWRFGHSGVPQLVEDIRSEGLGRARFGTVNIVGHSLGDYLNEVLPDAEFVDVSRIFFELRAELSPEMREVVRAAAAYAELAASTLVERARTGVNEAQLSLAAKKAVVLNGGIIADVAFGSFDGFASRYSPVKPRDFQFIGRTYDVGWRQRGLAPRVLREGDLMTTELHCWVNDSQAQAQLTLAIGRPSLERQRLFDAARTMYEVGLAAARPGATIATIAEAMASRVPPGAANLEPLVCSLNPSVAFSETTGGAAEKASPPVSAHSDVVLAEGMHLQIKPNFNTDAGYVSIGGGVLILHDRTEELNVASCAVQIIDT